MLEEDGRIDWLDQVIIEAGFFGPASIGFLTPSGQGNDPKVFAPGLGPNHSTGQITAHPGHAQVQKNDLRTEFAGPGDGLFTIVRGLDLVAVKSEQHGEGIGAVVQVVDDQNPSGSGLYSSLIGHPHKLQ